MLSNIKEIYRCNLKPQLRIQKKSNFANSPPPKLVAVSKKQNDEKVIEALNSGQKIFWRK